MKTLGQYFFALTILLSSCQGRRSGGSDYRPAKHLEVSILNSSILFNEKLIYLTIDSLDNFLYVNLNFEKEGLKKFPFPAIQKKDTLFGTCFKFELLENGKLIEGANLNCSRDQGNYFGYNEWLKNNFLFFSDSLDLQKGYSVYFRIPYYSLKNLKTGAHTLELRVAQETFFSAEKFSKFRLDSLGDTVYYKTRNFVKQNLLSCRAKFKFNMPPVYKTILHGSGLELRNDSVYSPVGMDNTIWNSSLPDIYWTVDYPENEFFCSTDYQKSTSYYDIKDTFCLYHYAPNDSISIGVWDHDNLSRDDYISYKKFSLNKFPKTANLTFAFENVKAFTMKVKREGVINK